MDLNLIKNKLGWETLTPELSDLQGSEEQTMGQSSSLQLNPSSSQLGRAASSQKLVLCPDPASNQSIWIC